VNKEIWSVAMSIIGRLIASIIGSIISDKVGKPIERSLEEGRKNTNRRLGYNEVKKRVDKRAKHAKNFLIHLLVFTVVIIILNLFTDDNPYSSGNINLSMFGMLWGFFVLTPHGSAVLVFAMRWSDKELEVFDQEKEPEKAKRKRRSNFNFSKGWDE
jgi:hypothetical protein